MVLSFLFGSLAILSLGLTLWQWIEARRFPLHRREADHPFAPPLTLLKPLKGCDAETETCLRSWFAQTYAGPVQILFGVDTDDDPVGKIVRRLQREFPAVKTQLVVCPDRLGANAKVSKLAQLQSLAAHDILVISDADVQVSSDLLANLVVPLHDPAVGLVNPFYQFVNATTLAMRWEALAVNADFWSSVLQSSRLRPLDFALGAVMAVRRRLLEGLGGFAVLTDHLADDYELGRRVAQQGERIALCPVVVSCRETPRSWRAIWRHQLRWSRTIRVCQPGPYLASIVSNATLWPLLWFVVAPGNVTASAFGVCLLGRLATAFDNQRRLTRSRGHGFWIWLAPVKDLLQTILWVLAFAGNRVEWRGEWYRVRRDGQLVRSSARGSLISQVTTNETAKP